MYSFNQNNRLKGKNISVGYIDTAMVILYQLMYVKM